MTNRKARRLLAEDLDKIEDINIRHTDSLLEYPTLGDVLAGEMSGPCRTHAVEQAYVALVVQKRVHLEHITRLHRSLALDSLLKFLH